MVTRSDTPSHLAVLQALQTGDEFGTLLKASWLQKKLMYAFSNLDGSGGTGVSGGVTLQLYYEPHRPHKAAYGDGNFL